VDPPFTGRKQPNEKSEDYERKQQYPKEQVKGRKQKSERQNSRDDQGK